MTFLSEMDEATGLLDEAKVFDKGRDLRKAYQAADPFPHIAIDDFLPETSRSFEIDRQARFIKGSGLPVRVPVIEMVEIGAGGGSLTLELSGSSPDGIEMSLKRLSVPDPHAKSARPHESDPRA